MRIQHTCTEKLSFRNVPGHLGFRLVLSENQQFFDVQFVLFFFNFGNSPRINSKVCVEYFQYTLMNYSYSIIIDTIIAMRTQKLRT